MRASIKYLIESYLAIDDEVVTIEGGVISIYAFNLKLATDVANWLVGHMADRGFEIRITERFMDYKVSLVRRN